MTTDTPATDPDARRVDEWCNIIRKNWCDTSVSLAEAQRNAARDLIRHAEREWHAAHRPGSLAFTGMPHPLFDGPPVTRLIDATHTTDEIRATLEGMAVGERGILVAIAAEILAVDAATNYPRRWVSFDGCTSEPVPFVLADELAGERVRVRWPLDEGDTGEPLLRGDS